MSLSHYQCSESRPFLRRSQFVILITLVYSQSKTTLYRILLFVAPERTVTWSFSYLRLLLDDSHVSKKSFLWRFCVSFVKSGVIWVFSVFSLEWSVATSDRQIQGLTNWPKFLQRNLLSLDLYIESRLRSPFIVLLVKMADQNWRRLCADYVGNLGAAYIY